MTDHELKAQSTVEAAELESRIVARAEIGDLPEARSVATRALGNALVTVVQDYLRENSSPDDVDLFFEVHGREPEDLAAWPATILADLLRHRIPAQSRGAICESAVQAADRLVRSESPLAWG